MIDGLEGKLTFQGLGNVFDEVYRLVKETTVKVYGAHFDPGTRIRNLISAK